MKTHKKYIAIEIWGGLGDILAITPALKALKLNNPDRRIIIYLPSKRYIQLLQHNPNIDQFINIKFTPPRLRKYNLLSKVFMRIVQWLDPYPDKTLLSISNFGTYLSYRQKAAHILAEGLNVDLIDDQLEIYLTKSEEQHAEDIISHYTKPVVIINPVSRSPSGHDWPLSNWKELLTGFTQLTFIQIGLPDEPLVKGAVDWRYGKGNSLRESIALIKYSDCYIGMDTLWQHVAAAVDTPGVVLFGDGHPSVHGHDIHINLYKHFRCAPCLGRLHEQPCPYDIRCIKAITVDEVASALTRIMHKKL